MKATTVTTFDTPSITALGGQGDRAGVHATRSDHEVAVCSLIFCKELSKHRLNAEEHSACDDGVAHCRQQGGGEGVWLCWSHRSYREYSVVSVHGIW